MSILRFKALEEISTRELKVSPINPEQARSYFSEMVFDDKTMMRLLPSATYDSLRQSIHKGIEIDYRIADQLASSMKQWAMSKGATHYASWFQPLSGAVAEKHDAFFELGINREPIERFEGSFLFEREPKLEHDLGDVERNTFEARGYTTWDPTSYPFVIGTTLCIPTKYVNYNGEALDYKTPLLKALNQLDKAATEVAQYFDKNITKVNTTLGWEQEFFVIDEALYNARPDIMSTGRALFGHIPARGKEINESFFSPISERVSAFLKEVEYEALRMGVPIKTRHNESAPNQFEIAPVFEEANLANDHNLLVMDLLNNVSKKHKFRVLFHEKPFVDINGSSKHCNWALLSDTGINLLQPGNTPKSNMRFLAYFVNTLKAIEEYPDLLRGSVATSGNEMRLGVEDAPPVITSVFIGTELSEMLNALEKSIKTGKMTPEYKTDLKMDIGRIPENLIDNKDAGRTAPIAFTGSKFEIRTVGSSANCASVIIALSTIVADQLWKFKIEVDKLVEKDVKKDEAVLQVIKKLITSSKKIRYEGGGYEEFWEAEAQKRGLSNIKDTPRALDLLVSKEVTTLFQNLGILSSKELLVRNEIRWKRYVLDVQIESRSMGDIVLNHIIPAAIKYQNVLIENIRGIRDILGNEEYAFSVQKEILAEISHHIQKVKSLVERMIEERKKAREMTTPRDMAIAYCEKVKPLFGQIKEHTDKLEILLDDEYWPLPKLRELLFTK